jgi:hypothetical protein
MYYILECIIIYFFLLTLNKIIKSIIYEVNQSRDEFITTTNVSFLSILLYIINKINFNILLFK